MKTRTKTAALAVASIVLMPTYGEAEESKGIDIPGDFSMTAGFVSDYVFRGITQSDEEPAVQGSLDYSLDVGEDTGVYLGVWGSSVDFDDGDEASTEFDFAGGVTHEIEGVSIDVGAIYYAYPGTSEALNYDYWEGKLALGYDFDVVSIGGSVNYSPENFGDSGKATYYAASAEVPLSHGFAIDGHIGRQEVEDNTAFGNPDYTDWSVGIATTIEGIDVKAQYVDTNLSSTDCADGCDSRGVLSVSKSF